MTTAACGKLGVEDGKPVEVLINVTPSGLTLVKGEEAEVVATIQAAVGARKTAVFRSSNDAVARVVSGDGTRVRVTAVAKGTATVTAIADADTLRRATFVVEVTSDIRSLSIVPKRAADTISLGASAQMTAEVKEARAGASTAVRWVSRDPSVLTVDAQGRAAAIATGSSYVVATSVSDSVVRDSLLITVLGQSVLDWTLQSIAGPVRSDSIAGLIELASRDAFAVSSNEWIDGAPGVAGALYRYPASRQRWYLVDRTPGVPLYGVWAPSQSDVFVVGAGGWIGRRFGSIDQDVSLIRMPHSLTANTLRGIWGASSSNVYAVGDGGVILHFDGTAWRQQTQTVTQSNLNAVGGYFAPGSTTGVVYAVGDNGTVLFSDGGGVWTKDPAVTAEHLRAVWVRSAGDAYAAGDNGVVVRYGTVSGVPAWRRTDPGTGSTRYRAIAANADTVFVVGTDGGKGVVSVSTAASGWTSAQFSRGLTAVSARFLAGWRGWMTRNPATPEASQPQVSDLASVTGVSVASKDVTYAAASGGRMLRFNAGSCDTIPRQGLASQSAVWAVSSDLAWFAGASGLTRVSGVAIDRRELAGTDLRAVHGVDADNGMAVGAAVARMTGGTWRVIATPATPLLKGVWMVNASFAIAVGESGRIVHIDGTNTQEMPSGTTQDLNGVWAPSRDFAIAVGNAGTVLFWDGTAWTRPFAPFTTANLNAVWGTRKGDVYVSGQRGVVARFDGATWRTVPVLPGASSVDWLTIAGTSTSAGAIIGGSAGHLARGRGQNGVFANGIGGHYGLRACD